MPSQDTLDSYGQYKPVDLINNANSGVLAANSVADKDRVQVTADKLKIGTPYLFQFQYVFPDGTLSEWSPTYFVPTAAIAALTKPKLTSANISYFQGILKVTWDGTDFNGTAYGNAFSKILIWIRDNSDSSPLFKILGELTRPGTFQIAVPPKSQTVKIQALSIDGAFSVYSDDFTITPVVAAPTTPTGLTPAWSGTDFTLSFTSDPSASANEYLKEYLITLTASDDQKKVFSLLPKSGTSQKFSLSLQENQAAFGAASQSFSGSIQTLDIYGNKGTATTFGNTAYVSVLPVPVITVTETVNGYSVAYTTPASNTFNKIHIEEVVSESGTAPSTGYSEVINGTSNPISYPSGTGKRWVRARFSDTLGTYTGYSNIDDVTPIDIVAAAFDTTPPTTAIINSAGWSGNDIIINATVASDAKKFIIRLTNGSNIGYFTKFPATVSTSQIITITESEMYNVFGQYYTSFSGLFISADPVDNRDAGATFNIALKTNPLASTTPTFIPTGIANGYSIQYTLPTSASYVKIYASKTSGFTPNDSTNLVYSGSESPAIIIDTVYTTTYVKIKYFSNDGFSSLTSAESSVIPLDAGMLSVIDNPVEIQTGGSILAGDTLTSGARLLLNETGMYLYDASAIVGTGPTTQILGNATSGSPTFITSNAKIANWKIYSSKIENELSAGITTYSGLAPAGNYAFWAGSPTAGGSATAEFYVTPAGLLKANNVNITGGTLTIGASSIAASTGKLISTDAEITGKITANSGEISGNFGVTGGTLYIGGTLYSSGTTPNTMDRIVINSAGINAYPANSATAVFQLDKTGFAKLNSANIAGWTTDTSKIAKTTTVGTDSWTIKVDSSTGSVQADATGYTAGFGVPDANNIVFWAGSSRSAAPFRVYKDGSVIATALTISGYATSQQLTDGLATKITTGGAASDVNNNSTNISGNKIRTGLLQSNNWNGTVTNGSDYSTTGMTIDLSTGAMTSPKFRIDTDGNASFNGTISANNINGGTLSGAQINIGNNAFTVSTTGVLNATGATISGVISSGTFTLNTNPGTNYWLSNEFSAGSSTNYLKVGSSGGITLYSSQSQSLDADEGGGLSSYNIDQKIVVNSSSITIQGIPGVGNGLTAYGNLLGPFGDGVASTLITQYWSAGATYQIAGREPSYNYGAAARYRMIVADPYDYNKLKRGFGVYYGVRGTNSAPSASTGLVGDIWISW